MFSSLRKNRKGFTLIELLVVIAIIAILSVVVILTLNPAELLKQARDSNRISDMATLKSAISLYLADVSTPFIGTSTIGYFSTATTSTVASSTIGWGLASAVIGTSNATTSRGINGYAVASGGWLPVNFSTISSGAPIGTLPVDPVNVPTTAITNSDGGRATGTFYGYAASATSFKLTTHMESSKYSTGGGADVETPDGGISTSTYEQGTTLTL